MLDDYGHGAVAAGDPEHPLVCLAVLLHVVLDELHAAPLQVLAVGWPYG